MDTVVVFDFDLTIIDRDSDTWVMEQLGFTELFESLLPTMPWNSLMDKMMGELHQQGKTIADIEQSLRTIPLYPETVRAIKFAFSLGCDLRIVSDANHFFIKTILESHDLLHYFTEIKANPAFVEDGRLRIFPFHPFTEYPHGCTLCPPNMCKGAVIKEMQKTIPDVSNKRFIYLGDGAGDFCPTLKLKDGDCVLPRKEYPLWKLIEKNRDLVKAQVHGWSDAKDVEDLLMKLLKPVQNLGLNCITPIPPRCCLTRYEMDHRPFRVGTAVVGLPRTQRIQVIGLARTQRIQVRLLPVQTNMLPKYKPKSLLGECLAKHTTTNLPSLWR